MHQDFQILLNQDFQIFSATLTLAVVGIIAGIVVLIPLPICAVMYYGVKRDRPKFIIPYLAMEVSFKFLSIIILRLLLVLGNFLSQNFAH